MSEGKDIGFARPSNSKKFHIFQDGRSLCGKWMFTGEVVSIDGTETAHDDDCKECFKRAVKRGLITGVKS